MEDNPRKKRRIHEPDSADEQFCRTMRQKESAYGIRSVKISQVHWKLLADWMIEVQDDYELEHNTLFLAANIVVRYLEKVAVEQSKLQLVAATALFIADKLEAVYPRQLDDYVYICKDQYTRQDIKTMELSILLTLDYMIHAPLANEFLAHCTRSFSSKDRLLAMYILELTLLDRRFMHVLPSLLAASVAYVVDKINDRNVDTERKVLGYTQQRVRLCAYVIYSIVAEKRDNCCTKKYSKARYLSVAESPIPFIKFDMD